MAIKIAIAIVRASEETAETRRAADDTCLRRRVFRHRDGHHDAETSQLGSVQETHGASRGGRSRACVPHLISSFVPIN